MLGRLLLLVGITNGSWSPKEAEPPLACLDSGACYQGLWAASSMGKEFASFQGVPYAQPPLGKLRFMAPEPLVREEGLWDVSAESAVMCPQVSGLTGTSGTPQGMEDCLLLNIYVPKTNSSQNMPVMVWIHGGSLITGSNRFADQGPQHFMDREVVVVVVNYRLGPLGFLSLGNDRVPGNMGLRDQVMALSWVQENIGSFGGDSTEVTVFGESAGSASIAYHLLSPLAKGLFKRAILQSSSTLASGWRPLTPEHARRYASLLSTGVGCQEDENQLSCLQEVPFEDIIALTVLTEPTETYWQAIPDSSFTSTPYLPGEPEELLISGDFSTEVEVVFGTTADEGLLYLLDALKDETALEIWRQNWDSYGPGLLFDRIQEEITDVDVAKAHAVVDFYLGGIENMNMDHLQSIIDIFTDATFLYGLHRTSELMLSHGMTVFQYMLTHLGRYSLTQLFGIPEPVGVCHADDLLYLWDPVDINPEDGPLPQQDSQLRDIMVTAWANFAKSGNPSGPSWRWDPLQGGGLQHSFLNISGPSSLVMATSVQIKERMDFWAHLLES